LPEKASWNINKGNIDKEEERTNKKMSFYFVLKWLDYEVEKKEFRADNLLADLMGNVKNSNQIKEQDELLATCYF
jgi:hypothetical protein